MLLKDECSSFLSSSNDWPQARKPTSTCSAKHEVLKSARSVEIFHFQSILKHPVIIQFKPYRRDLIRKRSYFNYKIEIPPPKKDFLIERKRIFIGCIAKGAGEQSDVLCIVAQGD